MGYAKYLHWDGCPEVWVDEDLKGKHREYCLCWNCIKFKPNPEGREENCPMANELFDFCVRHNMTTPVFECPEFIAIEPK